ncbi:class I SAM-dependent methyltransferase [Sinorhizobium numidicum]|uniref:Class I SAM-dependent methyltransferase n=1 Tax=Sinorhizobium numidicum TaxID=680248 RepID=A0ABY8D148_9HYPH|nr:class I SAM-dependent methyltransferase [Sinorhizobium numidicum]WEX76079.1 class I SAM-dependent methyltransferase [Sinorhizobium numidicum]WEX82738.1 class I SAM-dependent methyltransferase [Sinorhizobium numidicum]
MERESRQTHWENVYTRKGEDEVSWFQESPTPSLELIAEVGATPETAIVDIGGGASRLVDSLAVKGFRAVTVLDLSGAALTAAKARLGDRAASIRWIVADVTMWQPKESYDIWHDRGTFHFLTEATERAAYIERLHKGLRTGGHAIIATFAPDGPERCSGLPVMRYSPESLAETLGNAFRLVDSRRHEHSTPWGSKQSFQFSVFRHEA